MRLKAIKKLMETNLIYTTSPSKIASYRKKQAKKPNRKISVSRNLMLTYCFVGILYAFIFGVQAILVPLVNMPGYFSTLIGIFYLFIFSQGFLSFYNVFYESKDLQAYRPYAFSEGEVMIGKGISVLLTTLMGIFPIMIYVIILQFQIGHPIWLALPIALMILMILFSTLIFAMLVGVHFITKTAVFRKYKTIASNILLAFASLVGVGAIILVNAMNGYSSGAQTLTDQPTFFTPIQVFHEWSRHPFSLNALLGMGVWILVAFLLFILVRTKVLPEFYEAAMTTNAIVTRQKRFSFFKLDNTKDFSQFVLRYQLNLVSDGSVFVQSVLMSSMMPYLFVFPLIGLAVQFREVIAPYLTLQFGFPMILLAFFIASINAGGSNLTAIGLSLERENYAYLKALPFDMARYILLKFRYLFILQIILPFILFIIFCLLVGANFLQILLMAMTWGLTCLLWSAWGYRRDQRLMVTNWSNVTELFTRENSTLKAILALIFIIVYIAATAFIIYLILLLPSFVGYALTAIAFLAVLIASIFVTRFYLKEVAEHIEH